MGGGSGKRRGRVPLRRTCLSCLYCALGRSQQPVRGAPGTSRRKVPFPGYCARGAQGRLCVSVQHLVADSSPRPLLALRTHPTRGPRSELEKDGRHVERSSEAPALAGGVVVSGEPALGCFGESPQSVNISTNRILRLAEPVLTMTLTISRCHLSPLYRQETEGQPWKPTQVSEEKEEMGDPHSARPRRSLARAQAASAGSGGPGTPTLNGRAGPLCLGGLRALPPCPESGELAEVCVLGFPDPH